MEEHIKKINRSLVLGWMVIVAILAVAYIGEVVKGERTLSYLVVFMLITALPAFVVLFRYLTKPDRFSLRYEIVVGYFIMYCFVMMTGSTTMVFSYILPMLSLLVLYHQPKIIIVSGIASAVVNFISIYMRYVNNEINDHNSKDIEIQIALLFLCFMGAYLATKIYDKIHDNNMRYAEELSAQNEEILEQSEKLEAQNDEIREKSEMLSAQNEEIRAMNEEILFRNETMEQMTMQTITTIANTIDAKDEYTRGHSKRVSEYSVAVAKEIGYTEHEISEVRFIGLLHDIGKIGIPDSVLNKPGRLTEEEYQIMKSHTTVGADILKDIDMIKGLDVGAKYHHERIDGKGYPDGLKGDEIPMIARIIAVADAYDAMSSNRVYRRHLSEEKVLYELKRGVGTQWDEQCALAMIKLIEEKRLPKITQDQDADLVQQATTILSRVIDVAGDRGSDLACALDTLTSTFDRERGRIEIQNAIAENGHGTLYIFDIDHFHRVNATEGFVVGDHYLKVMVELIRKACSGLVISRFGADEFVVYNYAADTKEEAREFVERFFELLEERIAEDERISKMCVSVGATEVITEKDKVMVLYENADKAIYVAKQQKGNAFYCHQIFDDTDFGDDAEAVDMQQLIEMIKSEDGYKGCMMADYPEFTRMYEYIRNITERNRQELHIILFTVTSVSGIKVSIEERDRIMELLENAIVNSIRSVDVSTRYSSSQYAVLLMNLDSKEIKDVVTRIMTEFYRSYDLGQFELHYDAADLSEWYKSERENG